MKRHHTARVLPVLAPLIGLLAAPAIANDDHQCMNGVCIDLERGADGVAFSAENRRHGPVSLELSFPILENMSASRPVPLRTVLAPMSSTALLAISSDDAAHGNRWQWGWSWRMGVLDADHDESARYRLPWSNERRFRVGQAAGGSLSHHGKKHFSYDFWMPSGTPIHAARGGVVIRVVENYRRGGTREHFRTMANSILILHRDDSVARYLHLEHNGARVRAGQRVEPGELIGYSGNTGFSQGPHLHFDVFFVDEDLDWQTIDIRFADDTRSGLVPRSGQWLSGGAGRWPSNLADSRQPE